MRRARRLLTGMLVLLFVGLSFNAYACLVPIPGGASTTMGRGCSAPIDQSARQFCDTFKTLGIQASPELQPAIDCHAFWPQDTASLALLFSLTAQGMLAYAHPAESPPQDLLLKTTVLRL